MPVARPGHGRADSRSPGPAARAAGRFSRLFLMRRDHTWDWPRPVPWRGDQGPDRKVRRPAQGHSAARCRLRVRIPGV